MKKTEPQLEKEYANINTPDDYSITIGNNFGTNYAYMNLRLNERDRDQSGFNFITVNLTKENLLKIKREVELTLKQKFSVE